MQVSLSTIVHENIGSFPLPETTNQNSALRAKVLRRQDNRLCDVVSLLEMSNSVLLFEVVKEPKSSCCKLLRHRLYS